MKAIAFGQRGAIWLFTLGFGGAMLSHQFLQGQSESDLVSIIEVAADSVTRDRPSDPQIKRAIAKPSASCNPPAIAKTLAEQVLFCKPNGWQALARWMIMRAYLRAIYWAEGTLYASNPYGTMFTFAEFNDFSQHPYVYPDGTVDQVRPLNCAGSLCSAASGAPQIMHDTWQGLMTSCNLLLDRNSKGQPTFKPINQDGAAICLLREGGISRPLLSGWSVKDGRILISRENLIAASHKAAHIWASIPTAEGVSAYDQPSRPMSEFVAEFDKQLDREYELMSRWLAKNNYSF